MAQNTRKRASRGRREGPYASVVRTYVSEDPARGQGQARVCSALEVEVLGLALLEPQLVILRRILQELGRVGQDVLVLPGVLLAT
jgi:hypothetical protein